MRLIPTAADRVRHGWSALTGLPFHLPSIERLIDAELRRGGGAPSSGRKESTRQEPDGSGSDDPWDPAVWHGFQVRRMRQLARRAEQETPYYRGLFVRLGLAPGRLAWEDIARIPITPKEALRDRPGDFVRAGARIAFQTATTGTTGKPTVTYFSAYEMQLVTALSALSLARSGLIGPADIVQNRTSSRALLGSTCFTRASERVGAVWVQAGQVDPALGLALLRAEHRLPGKKARASFINVYSSYLGEMVTAGLAAGLGPTDFGLETISVGSEVVTAGLKERARELFGADVRFDESYALTETWPFGAGLCEGGHLHFNPSQGLLEVLDPDTYAPVGSGEVGVIVATPFAPYREASVVLRYDTQDLVRLPATPPTCSARSLPATSDILGKRKLAIRHEGPGPGGWTTPRDVLEALEGIRALPLPARCGFWSEGGGVAVAVLAPGASTALRAEIGGRLEAAGVPLRTLHLAETRDTLPHALPLRCDLREASFTDHPTS